VPEHFSLAEGLRASLAVGVPLALAVGLDQPGLAWAVFAAFWTCLGDGQGGDRPRRRLLGLFVGAGGAIALVGSLLAGLAPWAGVLVGPVLVFLSLAGAARVRFGGLVGTLLGVVAVVAVGFPQSPPAALAQALTFAGGGLWCWLLINGIWRIDARAALVRAGDGVLARLFDMAVSLVELGDGHHRDEDWHSDHGEHRRAVRLSIERLRALLERYPGQEAAIAPFERLRDAAETLFGAMIALDQAFIVHHGPVAERLATARAFRTTLLAWRLGAASGESLPWVERRLARLQAGLHDPLFVGCVVAQRRALQVLCAPDGQPAEPVSGGPVGVQEAGQEAGPEGPPQRRSLIPQWTLPQPALRQALRQTAGLVAVYALAALFHLGYPYWATMAVVVVLQGGARVTWARCLERIVGSLLGGTVAMVLLLLFGTVSTPVFAALAVVLAGVTIAMRQVNYTLFVVFLTMLFVIVTQILHPGEGWLPRAWPTTCWAAWPPCWPSSPSGPISAPRFRSASRKGSRRTWPMATRCGPEPLRPGSARPAAAPALPASRPNWRSTMSASCCPAASAPMAAPCANCARLPMAWHSRSDGLAQPHGPDGLSLSRIMR
jgi:uncharacterized membrane protein YccC